MSTPTFQALNLLNERLLSADAIGQAFDLASCVNPPAWVQVYREQIEAIRGAAEALETLVRQESRAL